MISRKAQTESAEKLHTLLDEFIDRLNVDAVPIVYGIMEEDCRLTAETVASLVEAAEGCEDMLRSFKDRLEEARGSVLPKTPPPGWIPPEPPTEARPRKTWQRRAETTSRVEQLAEWVLGCLGADTAMACAERLVSRVRNLRDFEAEVLQSTHPHQEAPFYV